MEKIMNRQWLLAKRPKGKVEESDFDWHQEPVRDLNDGEVLVRNIYLSLDPANRTWMREQAGYMPAVEIGSVMRGMGVGRVEESKDPNLSPGDTVAGMLGWQEYHITGGGALNKVPRMEGVPLDAVLALFGFIGPTAYFGLLDIGRPKEGETLVVSAAAGAGGSLAGQMGKRQGRRVIVIAGTDEKCDWLTGELGFDGAINYKTGSVGDRIRELCPGGVDVYFDNVGGEILDAVLANINQGARIVMCGYITVYNNEKPAPGPGNIPILIMKRARMEGFIVSDYISRYGEAYAAIAGWYREGKLTYRVDIVEGLEKAPSALNMLFDGSNRGKLMVKVSKED